MSIRPTLRSLALATLFAAAATAPAEEILAVRDDGALVVFEATAPGTFKSVRTVTGLLGGEYLLGVDFRPSDGALFGVGSTSRVYQIQTDTGFAVPVGGSMFSPAPDGG